MKSVQQLLQDQRPAIVREAIRAISSLRLKGYNQDGKLARKRARDLFELVCEAIVTRNVGPLLEWAEAVASERFHSGYDLCEVQTAINVLEEAIWGRMLEHLEPEAFSRSIGTVSSVMGQAKDAVARAYVTLAKGPRRRNLGVVLDHAGEEA